MVQQHRLIQSFTIQPGRGAHGTLQAGQILRIVDVQGQQVFDFSSFYRDDPTEYCDLTYSLFVKESWRLAAADRLRAELPVLWIGSVGTMLPPPTGCP